METINQYLKQSFAFYKFHHKNLINKILHEITIPIIILTLFSFLNYIDQIVFFSVINVVSLILIAIYTTIYCLFDLLTGILVLIPLLLIYMLAFITKYYIPYWWIWAILLHIASWCLQFLGHAMFEKNRPALLDSLLQAFIMAPLFVFMDITFYCGYRIDLHTEAELENLR